MSDCIKKGQAGLGSAGWVEQTTGIYHPSLCPPPSTRLQLARSLRGLKVCFGVRLRLVYWTSKWARTSGSPNRVAAVCALTRGRSGRWWENFLITPLQEKKSSPGSVLLPFSTLVVSSANLFAGRLTAALHLWSSP